MPRGSRPGERRGGRQRGTPNKNTILKNAVFCAEVSAGSSPLDFFLALMRDPNVPTDLRIQMAKLATPFVHARPGGGRRRRIHPMEAAGRLGKQNERPSLSQSDENACHAGDPTDFVSPNIETKLNGAEVGGKIRQTKTDVDAAVNSTGAKLGGAVSAGLGAGKPEASANANLSPLDYLLSVMNDPDAKPHQRIKAAGIAARYKHKPLEAAPMPLVVEDRFGFKVDTAHARMVRDVWVQNRFLWPSWVYNTSRDIEAKRKRLGEWLDEQAKLLECPATYTGLDYENDRARLEGFVERHWRQEKFTPGEDAEEAYLVARSEAYRVRPEGRALPRMRTLMRINALSENQAKELKEFCERFPNIRIDAPSENQAKELKELRERFPNLAKTLEDQQAALKSRRSLGEAFKKAERETSDRVEQ